MMEDSCLKKINQEKKKGTTFFDDETNKKLKLFIKSESEYSLVFTFNYLDIALRNKHSYTVKSAEEEDYLCF